MYLEDHDVVALSEAINRPEVAWWMLDFAGPGLKKMMNKKMAGILQNAPFKFAPENGLAYFEDLGWRFVDAESLFVAAHRFYRLPLFMRSVAWLPQPDPRHPGSGRPWSAVALLTRFEPGNRCACMTEAATQERDELYQMYMNGNHFGDHTIQDAFDSSIARASADINGWAARYRTDPESLCALIEQARESERRCGASNAATDLWEFFSDLVRGATETP